MKGFIIFASLLVFISCKISGIKTVHIPKPKGTTYPYAQVEPSIAIHPKDQNLMVAGTVLDDFYFSKDAGKTWTSTTMTSTYGVYGDPVLIFDTTGSAYYFHLASYKKATHLDRIVCQRLDEVDGEFTSGSYPPPNGTKTQDKPWACVDPITNDLYLTWTQFDSYNSGNTNDSSIIVFSKSSDKGDTWTKPVRISKFAGDCLDDDETVEGAVPTVGKNGEIFVVWSGPKGLVLQKSTDKGQTWLEEEQVIGPHHGGWTLTIPGLLRANGLPILTSDHSNGVNHGNLYLNWCDQKNGKDDTDSWLSVSEDDGSTWSDPIKVNQDNGKAHQFFTWMTVDQSTGNLYFIYYDRRSSEGVETDVYAACSKDGGKTFTEVKLTKKPFSPDDDVFFGDYLNIAAVKGTIRAIYPRMDSRKISLWVAHLMEKNF